MHIFYAEQNQERIFMKIIFWILAIISILVSLFVSFICYVSRGLGLYGTVFGDVVCILGTLAFVVSIVCMVFGIIKLRKGNVKKAVILALIGLLYSGLMIGGLYIDDVAGTMQMEKETAAYYRQLYGEDWDTPSALDGIPELYEKELNKYYAAVRNKMPADQLVNIGAATMVEYYGDASLENIGFILMDVNGDGIDELLVGTVSPVEEGGTAIFCIFSSPEDPFLTLDATEDKIYYLHSGEAEGTCMAEISGENAAWLLGVYEGESFVDITYQEGALDPADRLTLEMIPFSRYK